MSKGRFVTIPVWIPWTISASLAVFAALRGLDFLDAQGQQVRYLYGLEVLGVEGWGIIFLAQAAVLGVALAIRTTGRLLPLFAAHVAAVLTYTTMFWVVLTSGQQSWLWARALCGILVFVAMHAARAGALLFERMTHEAVAHAGR